MISRDNSLINLVNPMPNTRVMIYDVHASESGALAILDDLYSQIRNYEDKSIEWIFIVSTPEYEECENIKVRRFPWIKKNWGYRYFFDTIVTKNLIKEFCPDKVFSLQNKGVSCYKGEQLVYLHLPFVLTDYRFSIKEDGLRLWMYQNVISHSIFRSLRTVDKTIVQTQWMKDALVEKAKVKREKIVILSPDVSTNKIGVFADTKSNRKNFFYPATAFTYKNHMTMLKALNYAQKSGLNNYKLTLTIRADENSYTQSLYEYAVVNNLNVEFKGMIAREAVFNMYAESVLLFPSYVESFGLPLLEARLTNTYVVASDCSFAREILAGYDKASFFEPQDYETFGKLILELEEK